MRKKLLTESVLAQIPGWITESGLRPAEIAKKIGCTVGTLRVRCSHHRISLKQLPHRLKAPDAQLALGAPLSRRAPANLVLSLLARTRVRLQARAVLLGLSEDALVNVLIETIDKDDLYAAVLDDLGSRDDRAARQKAT
jgi:hypothetical protein